MSKDNIITILGEQPAPNTEFPVLNEIAKHNQNDTFWNVTYAYLYGFIRGKQTERARRKAAAK